VRGLAAPAVAILVALAGCAPEETARDRLYRAGDGAFSPEVWRFEDEEEIDLQQQVGVARRYFLRASDATDLLVSRIALTVVFPPVEAATARTFVVPPQDDAHVELFFPGAAFRLSAFDRVRSGIYAVDGARYRIVDAARPRAPFPRGRPIRVEVERAGDGRVAARVDGAVYEEATVAGAAGRGPSGIGFGIVPVALESIAVSGTRAGDAFEFPVAAAPATARAPSGTGPGGAVLRWALCAAVPLVLAAAAMPIAVAGRGPLYGALRAPLAAVPFAMLGRPVLADHRLVAGHRLRRHIARRCRGHPR